MNQCIKALNNRQEVDLRAVVIIIAFAGKIILGIISKFESPV